MKALWRLLAEAVAMLAFVAASEADAQPVIYEFSGLYGEFYDHPPPHYWMDLGSGYGGVQYQPFSAVLTYDEDGGTQTLDLTAKLQYAPYPLQLGGTSLTPGAATSTDTLSLPVNDSSDLLPAYGDVFNGPLDARFSLTASGLISSGQLRSGLTVDDLVEPALAGQYLYDRLFFGSYNPFQSGGPCYGLSSTLECMQVFPYWNADGWFVAFGITEIHQVVPESPAALLLASVAAFLGAALHRRRTPNAPARAAQG